MALIDVIHALPQQIREGLQLGKDVKLSGEFSHIVIAGMGGSGIPGDLLKTILQDTRIPITTSKDYGLPSFVNRKTLVFVISYSGNTEETLSSYRDAQRKGAKIVAITSGGKLREQARKDNVPLIIVPGKMPPRNAVAYFLFSIISVLHNAGISKLNIPEIKATMEVLNNPAFDEKAQNLAEQIGDKTPIIYSTEQLKGVALRWKQEFNENAKVHAFTNTFSEMNHNELMAYEFAEDNYHIILLKDERDHPNNRKRMDYLKKILKEKGITITEVMLRGTYRLVKIFTALYMGDLTSYYLAKKLGRDPIETSLIEDLKKAL